MSDVLSEMLSERERQRENLAAKLAAVDAEIRVLREAQDRMAGNAPPMPRQGVAPSGDGRALKPMWADVLCFIGSQEAATLDDIMAYIERKELPIQRNTLRSQVSIYTNRGWLERLGTAQFRLTMPGAAKCGYAENNEGPAEAEPSEVTGETDTLSKRATINDGWNTGAQPADPAPRSGGEHGW